MWAVGRSGAQRWRHTAYQDRWHCRLCRCKRFRRWHWRSRRHEGCRRRDRRGSRRWDNRRERIKCWCGSIDFRRFVGIEGREAIRLGIEGWRRAGEEKWEGGRGRRRGRRRGWGRERERAGGRKGKGRTAVGQMGWAFRGCCYRRCESGSIEQRGIGEDRRGRGRVIVGLWSVCQVGGRTGVDRAPAAGNGWDRGLFLKALSKEAVQKPGYLFKPAANIVCQNCSSCGGE